MRTTNILMHNGTPVIVSDNDEEIHHTAERAAKVNAGGNVAWNESGTRLFLVDRDGERGRFTGYEVRQAVKA